MVMCDGPHGTTRKLSLTEAGETYYERSRDIVRAVDEANLAVTEKRAGPSGVLRLTVPQASHVSISCQPSPRSKGSIPRSGW
jgi:DNA-binding transcriptional LysR family regulator